jgi:hypothetical protein
LLPKHLAIGRYIKRLDAGYFGYAALLAPARKLFRARA